MTRIVAVSDTHMYHERLVLPEGEEGEMSFEIEVVDYGVDDHQYFQGHGCSHTEYEHCSLGAGDTFAEAIEDALEQACYCEGFDFEAARAAIREQYPEAVGADGKWVATISAYAIAREEVEDDDDYDFECNLYYYVGLRWNIA